MLHCKGWKRSVMHLIRKNYWIIFSPLEFLWLKLLLQKMIWILLARILQLKHEQVGFLIDLCNIYKSWLYPVTEIRVEIECIIRDLLWSTFRHTILKTMSKWAWSYRTKLYCQGLSSCPHTPNSLYNYPETVQWNCVGVYAY